MKYLIAIVAAFVAVEAAVIPGLPIAPSVVPATTLVRTPQHDSAIIKSDRLGGNFAYSTVEGHAYAAVSPVVQNVVSPVGVSYTATPVATPINLVHQQYVPPQVIPGSQYVVAAPQQFLAPQPILAQQQVLASPQFEQIVEALSPYVPSVFGPAPAEAPAAEAIVAPVEAPAAIEAPAAPAPVEAAPEAPQSDDAVSVESV